MGVLSIYVQYLYTQLGIQVYTDGLAGTCQVVRKTETGIHCFSGEEHPNYEDWGSPSQTANGVASGHYKVEETFWHHGSVVRTPSDTWTANFPTILRPAKAIWVYREGAKILMFFLQNASLMLGGCLFFFLFPFSIWSHYVTLVGLAPAT